MHGNNPLYQIKYSSVVVKEDIPKLDQNLQNIIRKKINKLSGSPQFGIPLRGKLSKYFKLRISKYRVVYEINHESRQILILAIGKRENLAVYEVALTRIKRIC